MNSQTDTIKMQANKPKLVFDFPNSPQKKLEDIINLKAPKESYFGYLTMSQKGWNVAYSDDRWSSPLEKLRIRLRIPFELPTIKTLKKWQKADYVIITSRLSETLALFAKMLGKKVIFLDAICGNVPNNPFRKLSYKLALMLCDKCILISDSQAKIWADSLKIPSKKFTTIWYGIDTDFYKPQEHTHGIRQNIIIVGRDHSRDFKTVVDALQSTDIRITFVTLKHMLPASATSNTNINIRENIDYKELFTCYQEADIAVVPLKSNTTYMSGIRATLEAALTMTPIIATESLGLREYFSDEEIFFVDPENPEDLRSKILQVSLNMKVAKEKAVRAYSRAIENYSVEKMIDGIERVILQLQEQDEKLRE